MAPLESLAIASAGFKANPYPVYARLRDKAPVCRVALPRHGEVFLVTRYDDVAALLKDERFAKDPANALDASQLARQPRPPKMLMPLMRNMLALDDPDHARLRRLVQSAFTPRRIDQLEAQARAASANLLAKLRGRTRFDLIAEYALPFPVTVISDLLGVPKVDQARFARWSHTLIKNGTPSLSTLLALPGMLAFLGYLRRLIARKRAHPQDDLVSALVAAEADGSRLDSDELLAMVSILLSAGHETTTNLIGNGMLALANHPEQQERLRSEPLLIDDAVEELLRFASPVEMSTQRYSREHLEIAGCAVPRGSMLMGVIASANRDERQFVHADRLDVSRERNRHLTFGAGGHYCVGAALARLEGRVAIADLVATFPTLKVAVPAERLSWRPGLVLRGLNRLPVRVA